MAGLRQKLPGRFLQAGLLRPGVPRAGSQIGVSGWNFFWQNLVVTRAPGA